MAYGIFCAIVGAELVFSAPYWWLQVLGGLAALTGLFMMAGEEKTGKKAKVTMLEIGRELLRRTRNEK